MPHLCACCESPGTLRCSGCTNAWYCSKMCQKANWILHKFTCATPHSLTTADRLGLASAFSLVPSDMQTQIDYGFQRVSAKDRLHLLGLYQGLLADGTVRLRTLHRWQAQGVLAEEIKRAYEAMPPLVRGPCYSWFVKNEWVLDGKAPPAWDEQREAETASAQAAASQRVAWIYSGGAHTATDAQIDEITSKWPRDRQDCLDVCGVVLSGHYPGPDSALWVQFGFCTCRMDARGRFSIVHLTHLYQHLLSLCTFDQFVHAYESSLLYALFAEHGLGGELQHSHPLVEGILNTSPGPQLHAWYLKQFAVQESFEFEENMIIVHCEPMALAVAAYGFGNCAKPGDLEDLKAVYTTLFEYTECDPPELQRACEDGHLYAYISKLVRFPWKKKYRRLLAKISVPHVVKIARR